MKSSHLEETTETFTIAQKNKEGYSHDDVITGLPSHNSLTDFWEWAYGQILLNKTRGDLTEFIVATALGATKTEGWEKYDLDYNEKRIEVKSLSYIQSWDEQKVKKLSPVDISQKEGNDCYVIGFLNGKDRDNVKPLDLETWDFYVISTDKVKEIWGNQKSVQFHLFIEHSIKTDIVKLKKTVDEALF